MPEYEIMVVCEAYAMYTIEAESEEEAKDDAVDGFDSSDLYMDTATITGVLVQHEGIYQ